MVRDYKRRHATTDSIKTNKHEDIHRENSNSLQNYAGKSDIEYNKYKEERETMETKERKFTVITNDEYKEASFTEKGVTPPNSGYHTNPMYQKLLQFQENQRKKRFTVEDLLNW